MEDNKHSLSPLLLMLLGLLVSAVLGAVESQLLLHKTAQYKENMYWKYMIVFFVIAMGYVIWVYGSESYQPILPNTAKFIARVMLLSIPYILTLVFLGKISLYAVLSFLPAQLLFLGTVFIWHVASEIYPETEKHTLKIWIKAFFIGSLVFFASGLLELPDYLGLTFGGLVIFCYTLLILRRAINKKHINDLQHHQNSVN